MSLNNKLKVLYFNKQGIEVDTFLREQGHKLKNTRIFYVLSAKMDEHKVFKIGLSERGENSAFGRLKDYVHFYYISNNNNLNQGVKLYVCLANIFNPDVSYPDAAVRKLETKMKKDFKDFTIENRGNERFNVSIDLIFDYLEKEGIREQNDTEKPVRQTPRIQESNIGSNDAVEEILGHKLSKKLGISFLVKFKKSRIYDSSEKSKIGRRQNKYMLYDEVIQLRHGKRLLDEYIKDNILDE